MNTRNIEFVLNFPGHDVGEAIKKNYFNSSYIQRVTLRVSHTNAGDEDEILRRLEAFYRDWIVKLLTTPQESEVDGVVMKDSIQENTSVKSSGYH